VITYAAWGSWWVLLGLALLVLGSLGVIGYVGDKRT